MAKISDEIRDDFVRGDGVDAASYYKLLSIADRIDAEMMELPRDRDGVPIHVGDTVWINSGQIVHVTRIAFQQDKTTLVCWTGNQYMDRLPGEVTRERPDSWERIACELEGLSVDSSDNHYVSTHCSKLADRIRKLAEEGE